MTNEIKLKKLLDYGFITEEEQKRILSKLNGGESLLNVKKDILAVLEKDIKVLENKEKKLELEKELLETKISELNKKIVGEQKSRAKAEANKDYKSYLDFQKKNEVIQKQIMHEMQRLDRKSHEHIHDLKVKLEQLIMVRVKAKLKS